MWRILRVSALRANTALTMPIPPLPKKTLRCKSFLGGEGVKLPSSLTQAPRLSRDYYPNDELIVKREVSAAQYGVALAFCLGHLLVEARQASHAFAIGKRIAFYACFSSSRKSFAKAKSLREPCKRLRQIRALLRRDVAHLAGVCPRGRHRAYNANSSSFQKIFA